MSDGREQCAPSCLIPEFTAECTDECLVLACDDPDHLSASQSCLVTDGSSACDGSCITAAACSDCSGLDEILQCCTDYHSYMSDPRWYPNVPCDCTQDVQHVYSPSSIHHSIQSLISDPSLSSSTTSPSLSPFSPHLCPSPSPFPTQSASTQLFSCMWANCRSVFNNLSDLVGHVNLHHLCSIDASIPLLPSQGDPDVLLKPALSCHWGNCAMFPSSSSIPSSSSATSDEHVLSVLTTHLMQDHLGVNYPFPPSTPCSSLLNFPNSSDTVSSPPNPPSHDCSGTHPCRWKDCSQTFPSCDDLTAHIASLHIGGGKAHYDCFWQDCNRNGANGFSSKQKISRHTQSHTGHRPFQCQVCNQSFSEAATLQQHMRRHTRERPYICDFPGCGKAFAITGALTIHKRTHNGLRPFKCKFCDKAFSESSNLTKHLRTHTGARPYICTEQGCQKAFARPDQLARHMNVHRKKDPKG